MTQTHGTRPASEAAHDSHRFMQKFCSMHKAAQHKSRHKQCTVLGPMAAAARRQLSGTWRRERRRREALKALLQYALRRAPLPKLLLVAEMPRRMVPLGDAKNSMQARA